MNDMNFKKNVVVFGVGKLYHQWKSRIRTDVNIVAFLDNKVENCNNRIDEIPVYKPEKVIELSYDYIFIMSIYFNEMKEQLREIGVPDSKIYDIERMEELCICDEVKIYGDIDFQTTNSQRILMFSYELTSTGAQNIMREMIRLLKKNHYDVTVVSKSDGVLRQQLVDMGVSVVITNNLKKECEIIHKLIHLSNYILVNTLWLYYVVEDLSSVCDKIIWWIHEEVPLNYIGRQTVAKIINFDNVVPYVVSPLLKENISSQCNVNKLRILIFGLPDYYANSQNKRITDSHKPIIFAIIGYVGKVKGQDIFVRAIDKLPSQYLQQSQFWIIGADKLDAQSLKIVSKYDNIKIMGEIENQKMPQIYQTLDVVVACSRADSMSIVAIEGMMNEKLVIVSDAMGIADYIIDGQTGFITPCEDVEALTNKIMWVIDNQSEAVKIGKASRKVYDDYFAIEEFEKNILEVFSN